jgi:hypothetical protein
MRYASPVRWEGQSLLCPYPYRPRKNRPVGYGMIGRSKSRCAMLFEPLLNGMDRFLKLRDTEMEMV